MTLDANATQRVGEATLLGSLEPDFILNLASLATFREYVAQPFAPRVQQVVATDYADNMLAILRERMTRAGISNVEAVHRDVYALGPRQHLPTATEVATSRR